MAKITTVSNDGKKVIEYTPMTFGEVALFLRGLNSKLKQKLALPYEELEELDWALSQGIKELNDPFLVNKIKGDDLFKKETMKLWKSQVGIALIGISLILKKASELPQDRILQRSVNVKVDKLMKGLK